VKYARVLLIKRKQAIARAVYSRKCVVVLDDVFSGMDATTEHLVFNRLFGSEGLLRRNRTTVIIATHAGWFYSLSRMPQLTHWLLI
jgi:ABC-type nitrate/sulfonate/bicarbonate transport system ATPase subunit